MLAKTICDTEKACDNNRFITHFYTWFTWLYLFYNLFFMLNLLNGKIYINIVDISHSIIKNTKYNFTQNLNNFSFDDSTKNKKPHNQTQSISHKRTGTGSVIWARSSYSKSWENYFPEVNCFPKFKHI